MYSKRVAHYQPQDATLHCGHPRVKSKTQWKVEIRERYKYTINHNITTNIVVI